MRQAYRILVLLIVISLLPVLYFLASGALAAVIGCEVSPVSAGPCPVLGLDLHDMLRFNIVLGWLVYLPLLIAFGLVGLLAAVALGHGLVYLWRRRR